MITIKEMLKLIDNIEESYPLEYNYEEDAGYHWPDRWDELKAVLEGYQNEDFTRG